MGRARGDDRKRRPDKRRGGRGHAGLVEGAIERDAGGEEREERFDRAGVGAGLAHALEIELEVGGVGAVGKLVGLLVENDLIDEPAGLAIGGGDPGEARAGELLLQGDKQALEIPDREDMVLHEAPEALRAIDHGVDRMGEEPLPQVAEVNRVAGARGAGDGGGETRGECGSHG